jgi:hypothetical protein
MGGLRGIIVALASLFAVALVGVRAVTLWTEHGRAIARAEEGTRDWARILEEYARRTFQTGDLLADEVFRYARSRGGAERERPLGAPDRHRAAPWAWSPLGVACFWASTPWWGSGGGGGGVR